MLSALRGTEVVSDPTNVLALECASRLRRDHAAAVHLATSQRVIRTQPIPKHSGFTPHFRIFVLASGGREQREHGVAVEALRLHITTMLRALDRLEQHGFRFGARRLVVLARPAQAASWTSRRGSRSYRSCGTASSTTPSEARPCHCPARSAESWMTASEKTTRIPTGPSPGRKLALSFATHHELPAQPAPPRAGRDQGGPRTVRARRPRYVEKLKQRSTGRADVAEARRLAPE